MVSQKVGCYKKVHKVKSGAKEDDLSKTNKRLQNEFWMKHMLESRLPRETSITSDTQMTPLLRQKAKRN